LEAFDAIGAGITDQRREGYDKQYEYADAIKGVYGVFFFQHPSMLEYQERLKKKNERSNVQTILRVNKIPNNNQITRLLDDIKSETFAPVFEQGLETAQRHKGLDQYLVLGGRYRLITLDGVWFYQSENVKYGYCLQQQMKDGQTLYYHDMITAALVKPGFQAVLPLVPEFIRNEDGKEKQDCERNAAKRYLERKGERLRGLKPTFLGDDLYACHSICAKILDMGMSFIFTCRDESHPWIAEQVKYSPMEGRVRSEWNGRNHLEYRYAWVNGIENRAEGEKLSVNYLSLKIWNKEKDEITYSNSWITNKPVTADTAAFLAHCARTRWKIENEYNNVLKCRGYNLEHNFGHGQEHAADIYCLLNILAFLFHSIQDALDEDYQAARKSFGRRDAFFWALRYEICRYLHDDWSLFFLTVAGQAPDG